MIMLSAEEDCLLQPTPFPGPICLVHNGLLKVTEGINEYINEWLMKEERREGGRVETRKEEELNDHHEDICSLR